MFTNLVKALDFPPIRFHDLRHEAACLLGASSVPVEIIQQFLGQSSIVTTADIYLTIFHETATAAVAKQADLIMKHAHNRMKLGSASQA